VCAHIISVTLNTPAWTLLLLADWLARLWSRPATLDRTFVSISIYVSLARFFFFYFLLEALRWRAAMKLRRR